MSNDTNDLEQQNKHERDKLLHSIFTRTARSIDSILKDTAPAKLTASMLNSINQFLRLNDVSSATIPDEDDNRRETQELAAQVKEAMGDDTTPEERGAWNEGGGALENEFGKRARQSEPFDDR